MIDTTVQEELLARLEELASDDPMELALQLNPELDLVEDPDERAAEMMEELLQELARVVLELAHCHLSKSRAKATHTRALAAYDRLTDWARVQSNTDMAARLDMQKDHYVHHYMIWLRLHDFNKLLALYDNLLHWSGLEAVAAIIHLRETPEQQRERIAREEEMARRWRQLAGE